jgi:hypothetical protein
MQNHNNHGGNTMPLVYRSLCTRSRSYPQYILLITSATPIPITRQVLGNKISLALVASGHAKELPPLVDDIADMLCWLRELHSLMPLCCIYNVIALNLKWVYIMDDDHIHPFDVHYTLTVIATYVMAQVIFLQEHDDHLIPSKKTIPWYSFGLAYIIHGL